MLTVRDVVAVGWCICSVLFGIMKWHSNIRQCYRTHVAKSTPFAISRIWWVNDLGPFAVTASRLNTCVQHCTICNKDEGACVKCDSCPNTFHISCAWSAGYRFSFEILPFKEEWRNELGRTATFKEETGDMRALVLCKGHPWTYSRLLYDLGQKDRGTDLVSRRCASCSHAKLTQLLDRLH